METTKTVQWSDLPPEIWPMIGNRLDNRVDALRFRSVCKLWRSSASPFPQPLAPRLPFRFSIPSGAMDAKPEASLFQTTVYRMESIIAGDKPNSSDPWLLKLEESNSGRVRILHPVSNKPLRYSPTAIEFSLLDFRVVELRKSYTLGSFSNVDIWDTIVNKVVAMGPTHLDDCVVLMIFNGGNLGFLRLGDEKWTHVDEQNSHYDDLIVYKGQCYVIDKWGIISWINSELKTIQFSPPLCGFGGQKHLIECHGDLYVVDRYLEERSEVEMLLEDYAEVGDIEAVDFKVYKLDQEWGRWDIVKDLGDQVFILSNDGSFSVSSRDFARVKGNCILFTDIKGPYGPVGGGARRRKRHCRVFNLGDGSIRTLPPLPGYSRMLSPPSAWLSPNRVLMD